jgi:type IV pilus assembly protein PilC
MPTTTRYDYTVRDRTGKVIKGKLESDSRTAVANKLRSMGYTPLAIDQVKQDGMKKEISLPKLGRRSNSKS